MQIDGFGLKNFTDCTPDELDVILSWRNAPDVRRNSFSCELISRENHFAYVRNLSGRNDLFYFLVCGADRSPIGVISFRQTDKNAAEVGYYKAATKKNEKGVGALLLKLAEKAAYKINGGGYKILYTDVFSFNLPSIKSIERAGYKENIEKRRQFARESGEKFLVLRYELTLNYMDKDL